MSGSKEASTHTDADCTVCMGTGCRLGPDGCNGKAHPFIGCSTCPLCGGSGLASSARGDKP